MWGYDFKRPAAAEWRMALILALAAALQGCTWLDYYRIRKEEPTHTALLPCDNDNCGKAPK